MTGPKPFYTPGHDTPGSKENIIKIFNISALPITLIVNRSYCVNRY